jgi:hypothetical protein
MFSTGTPFSSASKTDRHDVTEILLKVVLNIITLMIIVDEKIHLFYIYEILEFNFCCWIEFYSSVSRSPFELNDGFPSLSNACSNRLKNGNLNIFICTPRKFYYFLKGILLCKNNK